MRKNFKNINSEEEIFEEDVEKQSEVLNGRDLMIEEPQKTRKNAKYYCRLK